MATRPYAIIDLDNCISDDAWRMHLCEMHHPKPNDRYWKYHDACHLDQHENSDIIREIAARHRILVFTSRPEIVRHKTESWLWKWRIPHEHLLMRPNDSHTPSVDLKREMLNHARSIIQSEIVHAIDDRLDILTMYEQEGIISVRQVLIHQPKVVHP